MSVTDVNREFYNKLYRKRSPLTSLLYSRISFDQQSKSRLNFKVLKEHFGPRFSNPLNVLDYGFGHGSLLLKYPVHHHLFGCDISEEAVHNFPAVAARAGKSAQTFTVNEFAERTASMKFDIITLSHIIEHVQDDVALVDSLGKLLSPDGVILINVPINEVWQDPKHVRKYNPVYLRSVLEKSNLRTVVDLEADKLTSFFLIHEKVRHAGTLGKIMIRALRAVFAIAPMGVVKLTEDVFLRGHQNQQLIVLALRS